MECIPGTLESLSRTEHAAKTVQQPSAFMDNEFSVDDLLDFSNVLVEGEGDVEESRQQKDSNVCSAGSQNLAQNGKNSEPAALTLSTTIDFAFLSGTEIHVPEEDLADLEWLSQFVEESFGGYPLTCPAGKLTEKPYNKRSLETVKCVETKSTTPVQTKARSKRARTGGRVWSPVTPSSSSSSSAATSSPSNPLLIYASGSYQSAESVLGQAPVKIKKRRKKLSPTKMTRGRGPPQARRCSHCGVHKTPQWRAGPLGAKTLCNACGVRFKSGRLLPEYRPACSPTFSSELHSNSHRKVLEMRRKPV